MGRTGGVYLAELEVISQRGAETLTCRPSDGLILATRMPVQAPILADLRLMETEGDVAPISVPSL